MLPQVTAEVTGCTLFPLVRHGSGSTLLSMRENDHLRLGCSVMNLVDPHPVHVDQGLQRSRR